MGHASGALSRNPIPRPVNLADGIGVAGDFGTSYSINVADLYRGDKTWLLTGTDLIDKRANSSFRYYATGSPFEYETVRFLYVRKRLIEDDGLHKHSAPSPPSRGPCRAIITDDQCNRAAASEQDSTSCHHYQF